MTEQPSNKDEEGIYTAIGHALVRWARLEHSLCDVFCEAVSPTSHHPTKARQTLNPASDAFWGITSFEGKIDITDAAVESRLHHQSQYASDQLLKEWTKVSKRIREKSRKRNKLAHGAILRVEGGTWYVPYYFKVMSGRHLIFRGPGGDVQIASSLPSSKEGMGVVQINAIRGGFDVGTTRLAAFFDALSVHNTRVSAEQAEARRFFDGFQAGQK